MTPSNSSALSTVLGPRAVCDGEIWKLDLTGLPIIRGLSVIASSLGDMVIEQTRQDRVDINVERLVHSGEAPELFNDYGIGMVKVGAESQVARSVSSSAPWFHNRLISILGSIQSEQHRELLFAAKPDLATTLVFQFAYTEDGRERQGRFLLDCVRSIYSPNRGALRITIECLEGRHTSLDSIRHVVVHDWSSRWFLAGSTRLAHVLTDGIIREAERGRLSLTANQRTCRELTRQLAGTPLSRVNHISVSWTEDLLPVVLDHQQSGLERALKRFLLVLEDVQAHELLSRGEVFQVVSDQFDAFIDCSELGRSLNFSFGRARQAVALEDFLEAMPAVRALLAENAGSEPLAGVRVFLIHHITAEVLGVIAALRKLGCRDIRVLFVAYGGQVPRSFISSLLDTPPSEVECMALANFTSSGSSEGYYRLSSQYSTLEPAFQSRVNTILVENRLRFFEAMQVVAVEAFQRQAQAAARSGGRCLVIEDGGYLAPVLNQLCRGLDAGAPHLSHVLTQHFAAEVAPVLLGTIEHTRNGLDRLKLSERQSGGMAFPAISIALSRLKVECEAGEVAVSVLNAIENVLHSTGRILRDRHCLLIGSHGVIGTQLKQRLETRLRPGQIFSVDLQVPRGSAGAQRAHSMDEVPDSVLLRAGLVIGVAGESVITGREMQHWLLDGSSKELILASGSTKTVEFADVALWIDNLLQSQPHMLGDHVVTVRERIISDPQTERNYGKQYRFHVRSARGEFHKDLLVIANGMPVNFLFYGVPSEMIEQVLAQLVGSAVGLVKRALNATISPQIYEVDLNVDDRGQPLEHNPAWGRLAFRPPNMHAIR